MLTSGDFDSRVVDTALLPVLACGLLTFTPTHWYSSLANRVFGILRLANRSGALRSVDPIGLRAIVLPTVAARGSYRNFARGSSRTYCECNKLGFPALRGFSRRTKRAGGGGGGSIAITWPRRFVSWRDTRGG